MALCENCFFYDEKLDKFLQNYEDCEIIDEDRRIKHHCRMHDDYIPHKIFYDGADCPLYEKKINSRPRR